MQDNGAGLSLNLKVPRDCSVPDRNRKTNCHYHVEGRPTRASEALPYQVRCPGVERLQDLRPNCELHWYVGLLRNVVPCSAYVALFFIGLLIPVYAVALFTPTIVKELGFSAANAQLLSIPPFVAGCIATIAVGVYSDKFNSRGPFIIGGSLISMIGYIILYTQTQPGVSYFGACLAAVGVYPTIAIALAWAGSAVGGDIRKGVTIAMVIGIGNLGGVCASFIYLKAPRFHVGHGTCMGFLGLSYVNLVYLLSILPVG